jgi:16S rRNA (guanine966-N2)-methyltransferase
MIRIIGGRLRRHTLINPGLTQGVRPTTDRVREALFNILCHTFSINFDEISVLDAFAGSGALGLEALSRGATCVHFCEKNPAVQKILAQNIQKLGGEKYCRIWLASALQLHKVQNPVDLIFLDPPYGENLLPSVCLHLLEMGWIGEKTLVCAESSHEGMAFPENLQVQNQRVYGHSMLTFLTKV